MIFLDTSVLVAAAIDTHVHFQPSIARIEEQRRAGMACSAHTLAEAYNTLTTYRLPRRIRPREAYELIQRWKKLCRVIALSPQEYLAVLQAAAAREIAGAAIYDALHIACARKAGAERIYTWNTRHFKAVAPDLAAIIFEP